jgi:hypothetical protein
MSKPTYNRFVKLTIRLASKQLQFKILRIARVGKPPKNTLFINRLKSLI